MRPADKLRLLLLYAASHPEKFDDAERARWSKASGLSLGDVATVSSLERLGVKVSKPKAGSLGAAAANVGFKTTKAKRRTVHERKSERTCSGSCRRCTCWRDRQTRRPCRWTSTPSWEGTPPDECPARAPCRAAAARGAGPAAARRKPRASPRAQARARGATWATKHRKPSAGGSSMGSDAEFSLGGSAGSLAGLGLDDASHARVRASSTGTSGRGV